MEAISDLKVALKQGGRSIVMKGFGMGERAAEWAADSGVDAAFEIERDLYFGGLSLILREMRGSLIIAITKATPTHAPDPVSWTISTGRTVPATFAIPPTAMMSRITIEAALFPFRAFSISLNSIPGVSRK